MKRKIIKGISFILVFMFIFIGCSAREGKNNIVLNTPTAYPGYYVSVINGNDVNSGTIDSPLKTISKAINLAQTGDFIYVRAGTYPSFAIMDKSNITISGYNNEYPLITGNFPISLYRVSYITISGFEVTGATTQNGIKVSTSNNVIIKNNKVHDNNGMNVSGIFLLYTSNSKILNNIVYNNYRAGIAISGAISTDNEVAYNTTYNHTASGGDSDGITCYEASLSYIHNNIVYGNSDDGIDTFNCHHNTIAYNIVRDSGGTGDGNGIKAGGGLTGGYNLVVGNISYNNEVDGITCNRSGGNKYYHNVSYGNGYDGISDNWRDTAVTNEPSSMIGNISYNNAHTDVAMSTGMTGISHNNFWGNATWNYGIVLDLSTFYNKSKLDNPNDGALSSYTGNPGFVNANMGDFNLLSTSQLIDKGDPSNPGEIVSIGIPDIGAIEYDGNQEAPFPPQTPTHTQTVTPAAKSFYISMSGNDNNSGTLSSPFKTIQKCLNVVVAGEVCLVRAGTYNENLVINKSGTSSSPITLARYEGEDVTINGGTSYAIRDSGGSSYWIIDGFTITTTEKYSIAVLVTSSDWGGSITTHWIIRNNTILGGVSIRGNYHLIENNTINGQHRSEKDGRLQQTGIRDTWGGGGMAGNTSPSHHNVYRGNTIFGFSRSGIWSMGYTHDNIIEYNRIYDIYDTGNMDAGQCINLDGAGTVEWRHIVRGNDVSGCASVSIALENVFDTLIENNYVHDTTQGIGGINYGSVGCKVGGENNQYGDTNGDGNCVDANTNNIIRQNVVVNASSDAFVNYGMDGVHYLNNSAFGGRATMTFSRPQYLKYSDAIGNITTTTLPAEFRTNSNNITPSGAYTNPPSSLSPTGAALDKITAVDTFQNSVTGSWLLDFDGNPRLAGALYDIGAYEKQVGIIATSTYTLTPTLTPTNTSTPTQTTTFTPTQTATLTPSQTNTSTQTPIFTPELNKLCVKSVWGKTLHERVGATMNNPYYGVSVEPGAIIFVEGFETNSEGDWARINYHTWIAMKLHRTLGRPDQIYAIITECPK
jgi:parallel beta-helix repeat protein